MEMIILLIILIASVIIHEIAHGAMALALGDKTAKNAGRLSLNPIKHIDPFGSILLPLITMYGFGIWFGYAKPVPINPTYFKDQRKGMMLTSIAGPFSNFALAIGAAALFQIFPISILALTVILNLILGILNLLPIPPLDGSKVIAGLLPRSMLSTYYKFEFYSGRYIFIIILIVIYLAPGVLGSVIRVLVNPLIKLLGVPFGI